MNRKSPKETSLDYGERARVNNVEARRNGDGGLENLWWSATALAGREFSAVNYDGAREILRDVLNRAGCRRVREDCIRKILVKLANQTIRGRLRL